MIAACCNCRNEADIIGVNLRHLLGQGIDRIYVCDGFSADETWDVLAQVHSECPDQIVLTSDQDPIFLQTQRINALVQLAVLDGATWLLAFDADEFFVPVIGYRDEGMTIADTLNAQPPNVRKLYCRNWQHHDWDYREATPLSLPKVVFRWTENARLAMGQHEVDGIGGGVWDILESRHLQYRSFAHFCAKVRDYNARIDPVEAAKGNGAHITRMAGWTDEQMKAEWDTMRAVETVYDPIPA